MFKQKLIYLRKQRGWTQDDVSRMLGVHRGTYANYEVGKRVPDYETLDRIADLYGVSVDFLLDRTDRESQIFDLERKLREGEITYKGEPLTKEQCEYLADFLEVILKRGKKTRDPKSVAV